MRKLEVTARITGELNFELEIENNTNPYEVIDQYLTDYAERNALYDYAFEYIVDEDEEEEN